MHPVRESRPAAQVADTAAVGPTELLTRALALHRSGRLDEAASAYRKVLAQDPGAAEVHNNLGLVLQGQGRLDEAMASYRMALSLKPGFEVAHANLGNVLHGRGDLDGAVACYQRAIASRPDFADAHYNLGVVLRDKGKLPEAIESYRRALQYRPDNPTACLNLGNALQELGKLEEAAACYAKVTLLKPDFAEAYCNLGNVYKAQGKLDMALDSYRKATQVDPGYAPAYLDLGINYLDRGLLGPAETSLNHAVRLKPNHAEAYSALGQVQYLAHKLDEAQASFTRAVQLKPGRNADDLYRLAGVYKAQGRFEQAIATYQQAHDLSPHDLKIALDLNLSLPVVVGSRDELLAVRERFRSGLRSLHERSADFVAHNRPEKLLEDLRCNHFYLAYQGLDDKPLQVSYAQFVAGLLNSIAPQFMQPLARKDAAGRRLRIGFLSSFFRECTVSRYFGSWITRIERERFETFVYHTYPEQDRTSQAIAAASDHFRHLTGQHLLPQNMAAELLADDLDILVYPELGMDSIYFLLAAMRLAPLQCAGWGHPVTSGHANIDCYFSSAAMEPDDAQAHYSERLVLLDGIGTCYSKPVLPAAKRRADFALPEGRTLYLCPQSLFKIHPDNDALLARVLQGDPNGVLVLFAGSHPNITSALFQRLTRAMLDLGIDPKGRGVILPPVSHADYLCINMLCDVMLDTLHWSGGNTSLDAIACSLPVVTLPGEFMRGRQSYAMLKLIGLDELVAADQDDYVGIATRLGTDRAWRNEVARHLSANCDVIFDQGTALRQMEQFYIDQFSA